MREAYNAVFVEAESAGRLMFYGAGAGGMPTASAVLGDVVAVARNRLAGTRGPDATTYAGLPVLPPQSFSRPVDMPGGSRDAAFRTVRLERDAVAAGRLFFCHHLTPELVWHDPWRRHANGVVGITGATVAAADPSELLDLFARMFGADAVHGGVLSAGLSRVEVVTPAALQARYGRAAPDGGGRRQFMAALHLRTLSLGRVDTALAAGGVAHARADGAVTVAADDAGGVTLVFGE